MMALVLSSGCATNADLGAFLDSLNQANYEHFLIDVSIGRDFLCSVVAFGDTNNTSNEPPLATQVQCVGENGFDQITGYYAFSSTDTMTEIKENSSGDSLEGVWNIASGLDHTCAFVGDDVRCWGENFSSQTGAVAGTTNPFPDSVATDVHTTQLESDHESRANDHLITAGSAHTCMVNDDRVKCWGSKQFGNLGDGNVGGSIQSPQTVEDATVNPVRNVIQVSAGNNHTCALKDNGEVWCWGRNHIGQLGYSNTTTYSRAIQTKKLGGTSLDYIVEIDIGEEHSCALRDPSAFGQSGGRQVWCWGDNGFGQLYIDPDHVNLPVLQPETCGSGPYYPCSTEARRIAAFDGALKVVAGDRPYC